MLELLFLLLEEFLVQLRELDFVVLAVSFVSPASLHPQTLNVIEVTDRESYRVFVRFEHEFLLCMWGNVRIFTYPYTRKEHPF